MHFALDGLVQFLEELTLVTSSFEHYPETGLIECEVEEVLDGILELPLAVATEGASKSLTN